MGHGYSSDVKFKCVLLGETGSGKTSFLNLIVNASQIMQLSEGALTLADVQHLHKTAQTEGDGTAKRSESQTKSAHAHIPKKLGIDLTVIDTPGFADTSGFGLEEDQKHTKAIQDAIIKQDSINCIVLVINGKVEKITHQLRHVLTEVQSILPKTIMDQLVIVFTNVDDPDMDLNFDLSSLPDVNLVVPRKHMFFIDNPYAKLTKVAASQSLDMDRKIRRLDYQLREANIELKKLFKQISLFKPIETAIFKELFDAKKEIEKKSLMLNQQLENINIKTEEVKKKRKEVEEARNSAQQYAAFTSTETKDHWDTVETPDEHHMICSECRSTCHQNCKIQKSLDKISVFKDCECFQSKTRKVLDIREGKDKQILMRNVFDEHYNVVDVETGEKCGERNNVSSNKNFEINGVKVRGDPDTTWIGRFSSRATSADEGMMCDLCDKLPPFKFVMVDWTNVERGDAMLCSHCNHPLSCHSHQTVMYQKSKKTESVVDSSMKAKFDSYKSDEERQKAALDSLDNTMQELEKEKETVMKELQANLAKYEKMAASDSYVGLLNEQKIYLQILQQGAKKRGELETVNNIQTQLDVIQKMTESTEKAGGKAATGGGYSLTSMIPSVLTRSHQAAKTAT